MSAGSASHLMAGCLRTPWSVVFDGRCSAPLMRPGPRCGQRPSRSSDDAFPRRCLRTETRTGAWRGAVRTIRYRTRAGPSRQRRVVRVERGREWASYLALHHNVTGTCEGCECSFEGQEAPRAVRERSLRPSPFLRTHDDSLASWSTRDDLGGPLKPAVSGSATIERGTGRLSSRCQVAPS